MTEEEIIEEMLNDLFEFEFGVNKLVLVDFLNGYTIDELAEHLIAKGYRKEKTRYILKDGNLEMIPTVESVRQEVAREIFAEIRKEIELALDSNYKARNANGYGEFGEYVNGKIHALRGIDDFLAELKKEYIGE